MSSRDRSIGKEQKNFRLSDECRRLLALIANADGIGESAVIELVVRKEAKFRGFLDGWGLSPKMPRTR